MCQNVSKRDAMGDDENEEGANTPSTSYKTAFTEVTGGGGGEGGGEEEEGVKEKKGGVRAFVRKIRYSS